MVRCITEKNNTLARADFPILQQQVHGDKPLAYLDSGASTQKPQVVIDALSHFYQQDYANVHRGVYQLSERATNLFESSRETVRQFINAPHTHEIIFTKGTTDAINLVASSFGRAFVQAGDEIIVSVMEHHSNIVPWQIMCDTVGATLRVIPMDERGVLDLTAYEQLLSSRTKLVAIIHASNVLGTINPVKKITAMAHDQGAAVLVDGAQAVAHLPVDVQDLDCDFYVFSGHKLYGPTGVGVLYGKADWLDRMPPYQSGGDMISRVSFEKTDYNVLPYKFEAGTPPIAGVIGLSAAINYLQQFDWSSIINHELELLTYLQSALGSVPGLRIIGTAPDKIGVASFVLDQVHPHDVGTILDSEGVAIRAGHHCAMPLIERLGVPATVRASLGIYNNTSDIDRLMIGLEAVLRLFSGAACQT